MTTRIFADGVKPDPDPQAKCQCRDDHDICGFCHRCATCGRLARPKPTNAHDYSVCCGCGFKTAIVDGKGGMGMVHLRCTACGQSRNGPAAPPQCPKCHVRCVPAQCEPGKIKYACPDCSVLFVYPAQVV